jgi:hypothetical protein
MNRKAISQLVDCEWAVYLHLLLWCFSLVQIQKSIVLQAFDVDWLWIQNVVTSAEPSHCMCGL